MGSLLCVKVNMKYEVYYNVAGEGDAFLGGPSSPGFPAESRLDDLPNACSAPYEVPQFPIEQIETKLAQQRQLSSL